MAFLFHELIFGPVRSRRLGLSLGINLLPTNKKYCSFNCIYCECGFTPGKGAEMQELPTRQEVALFLEKRLQELVAEDYLPDVLTYAGNGEPTLHPEFAAIVDDTIALRNKYVPAAQVSVLSNASRIHLPEVFRALQKIDNNILKLDAGTEKTFRLINNPDAEINLPDTVNNLGLFNGQLIIQSLFLRGTVRGEEVDNTTDREVAEWIKHLVGIRPKMVMIYPIARETPVHTLEKIGAQELETIAAKVAEAGLNVKVYG